MPAKTAFCIVLVHTPCTSLFIRPYLLQIYVKLSPVSDMLPSMHKRVYIHSPLSVFILDLIDLRKRMYN